MPNAIINHDHDKNFKNSPASKVPWTKPIDFEILYQTDSRLNENINKFGCNFMATLAIPQIICHRPLNPKAFLEIYAQGVNGNLGPDVLGRDCSCKLNFYKCVNLGFKMLGHEEKSARWMWASERDGSGKYLGIDAAYKKPSFLPNADGRPMFFIVDFNTSSDKATYGGHHFTLFNSIGDLLYDPGGGSVHSWLSLSRIHCWKVFG